MGTAPLPDPRAPRELLDEQLPGPAGELEVLRLVPGTNSDTPPILFVHGLAGSAHQWEPLMRKLPASQRAAALSLRGHGESSTALDYSISALSEDIQAAADALDFDHYLLVAHSLGATVATAHAAEHPERVAGLLLVDPNGDQTRLPAAQVEGFLGPVRDDPIGEMRFQFGQILAGASEETSEAVLAALNSTSSEALLGALESAATHSPKTDLESYDGPALSVITPLNSLPISLHQLLPRRLPTATLLASSHWVMLDRPEELSEILGRFVAEVRNTH